MTNNEYYTPKEIIQRQREVVNHYVFDEFMKTLLSRDLDKLDEYCDKQMEKELDAINKIMDI